MSDLFKFLMAVKKIGLLLISTSLIGCNSQYWSRSDSIYLSHGDAVRSNIAVQVPDPWPKNSENTNIPLDPVKAQHAMECYRTGKKPSDPLGPIAGGFRAGSGAGQGSGGDSATDGCQQTGPSPVVSQTQEAQ